LRVHYGVAFCGYARADHLDCSLNNDDNHTTYSVPNAIASDADANDADVNYVNYVNDTTCSVSNVVANAFANDAAPTQNNNNDNRHQIWRCIIT